MEKKPTNHYVDYLMVSVTGETVSFAYVISHEKLNLYIAIVDVQDLHLHEEVIPAFLEELARSIKEDGCLKHPIIVDKASFVVLDGMHRVAALEKLGCKRIPVCLVDYKNPGIKVGCWYRVIKGVNALARILSEVQRMKLTSEEAEEMENKVGTSPVVAVIKNRERAFLVCSQFENLKETYDIIKKIENRLKASELKVDFETEQDALRKLQEHEVDAVLQTPRPTKKAVVETALSGKVFSYKATRHIIPARPLYVNVPLSLLKDGHRSLSEVNGELRLMLQKRHLTHVLAGSLLNGRRYEEDLYIFKE